MRFKWREGSIFVLLVPFYMLIITVISHVLFRNLHYYAKLNLSDFNIVNFYQSLFEKLQSLISLIPDFKGNTSF